MLFRDFVDYLQRLERITSRLEISKVLSELIEKMKVEEVDKGIYLTLGMLGPDFDNPQFNMAVKMVIRSLSQVTNTDPQVMEKKYKRVGDLGLLAEENVFEKHAIKKYTVEDVYHLLAKLAEMGGVGSQERKVVMLADLFGSMSATERKFVARIVIGKLRLGFTEKTIFDALSQIKSGNKDLRKKLDGVFQIYPDCGYITKVVKESGVEGLNKVEVKTGIPVVPALCQRLNNYKEIINKMKEVAVERKYDGTRVQIHFNKTKSVIKTYTRNLEESSQMFPELQSISKWIKAREVILDSEAVGVGKTGEVLPFQLTITRKRKHGIEEIAKAVPLRFFVFDILSLDGRSLLGLPYFERRKLLSEVVEENSILVLDEYKKSSDPQELQKLHDSFLKEGLEGAVMKKWDGEYLPGRQGWNWVKIKEVEGATGKLADTFDLVILGYYFGRGKRTGFGIGAFLVGVMKGGVWVSLAKIGTGLSDDEFRGLKTSLDKIKLKEKPANYSVSGSLEADVWVEPKVVVEVAADEITKSPAHAGGIALRFPRLIRFREDKGVKEATTWPEVVQIAKISVT